MLCAMALLPQGSRHPFQGESRVSADSWQDDVFHFVSIRPNCGERMRRQQHVDTEDRDARRISEPLTSCHYEQVVPSVV